MTGFIDLDDSRKSDEKYQRTEAKLAVFRVGPALYAIDILRIKEIIRPLKLTSVPNSPSMVEGMINLRGAVIPVIDLRKCFSVECQTETRKVRMIICVVFRKLFALVVDEVVEVRNYGRDELQPALEYVQGAEADVFLGVGHFGDELLMILDLERFLAASRIMDLPLSTNVGMG